MSGNQTALSAESAQNAIHGHRAPEVDHGVLVTVAMLLAWVLALYYQTTLSMVSIWERSETFAHGFVVFPIFLYLLWRQRVELAAIERARCLPALLGIAVAGALWFVGERVHAVVVSQMAMIAMVPFAVWAVLGTRVAAALCIPLLFLFFAVPFGDFLIPTLMDRTADFTVAAIKASGVPVYREGNYFTIPSGQWSVVEACSGLRYLIASFMVGCLYAYLSYRSPVRRAAFIVASLIVPIIANWLRAYMIVMLGHLSSNRLAVGADHLVYGWVFFGLVMALLFWMGSRWREDDLPVTATGNAAIAPLRSSSPPLKQQSRHWPVLLAIGALTAMWPLLQAYQDHSSRGGSLELGRVSDRNGWVSAPGELSDWAPDISGANAELRQTFAKDGNEVGLQLSVYRNQTPDTKAITITNQLVRSKNERWKQVGADSISMTIDRQPFTARTAVVAGLRQRLEVWQWFWVDGRETSSETLAKLFQAISVLRGHGDTVAWVFAFSPTGEGSAKASATLQAFSTDMRASIDAALRKAVAP